MDTPVDPPSPSVRSNGRNGTARIMLLLLGPICLLLAGIFLKTIFKSLARSASQLTRLAHARLSNRSASQLPLPAASPGLDQSIITAMFPVFVYRSVKDAFQNSECVVCLSAFEEGDSVRVLPHCRHGFHMVCIDQWLESHSSCPVCREDVVVTTSGAMKAAATLSQQQPGAGDESEPGQATTTGGCVLNLPPLDREASGRWRDEQHGNLLGSLRRSFSRGSVLSMEDAVDEGAGYGDGGRGRAAHLY